MSLPLEKLLAYSDKFYDLHRQAFDASWTNLSYRLSLASIKLLRAQQYYAELRPEEEAPLLLYENRKVFGTSYVGFLFTVENFHYLLRKTYLGEIHSGKIPLQSIRQMELMPNQAGLSNYNLIVNGEPLANLILYPEEYAVLNAYMNALINGKYEQMPEQLTVATAQLKIIRDLLHPETGVLSLYQLVREETEHLYQAIQPLIDSAWEGRLVDALLHDLRVILHICGYADRQLDPREIFPFVYVAGRFANDHTALSIFDTLQQMDNAQAQGVVCTLADSFDEWIHEVKGSDSFQLPAQLHRWDRRHRTDSFTTVTHAMYRFANVYVKADGMVKPEEEHALQQVWDQLHLRTRPE